MQDLDRVALKEYWVEPISFQSLRTFIEQWHHSHSVRGLHVSHCFALFRPGCHFGFPEMVGGAILGKPSMSSQVKKWSPNNPDGLLELRRFVCKDSAPKNTESYFLGYILRWLRKNTDFELVIAYADPDYGHKGTIFRASNWILVGVTQPGQILIVDGERYHDRTLRVDKPYARKIQERLTMHDEAVSLEETSAKRIFLYRLREG